MPGAVVTITHPDKPVVRVAVTNQRGEYVVQGLEPGAEYVVHVTHPKFRKQKVEARAYAADRDPMLVRLTPRRTSLTVR